MGSGAVESCVRRLVNLRLKGNSVPLHRWTTKGVRTLRMSPQAKAVRRLPTFVEGIEETLDLLERPAVVLGSWIQELITFRSDFCNTSQGPD